MVGSEIGKVEVYTLVESLGADNGTEKGSSNGRSDGNGGIKLEGY